MKKKLKVALMALGAFICLPLMGKFAGAFPLGAVFGCIGGLCLGSLAGQLTARVGDE